MERPNYATEKRGGWLYTTRGEVRVISVNKGLNRKARRQGVRVKPSWRAK